MSQSKASSRESENIPLNSFVLNSPACDNLTINDETRVGYRKQILTKAGDVAIFSLSAWGLSASAPSFSSLQLGLTVNGSLCARQRFWDNTQVTGLNQYASATCGYVSTEEKTINVDFCISTRASVIKDFTGSILYFK